MRAIFLAASAAAGGLLLLAARAMQRRRRRECLKLLARALPKVELHAHLNGCARLSTIRELAPPGVDTSALNISPDDDRSLAACFSIFDAIHKTVTTLASVRRVTAEVLEDFASDGVRYLELRTTPRALADADAEGCVRAVLGELRAFEQRNARMVVRVLLSINRTGSLAEAEATVAMAARLRQELSGSGGSYIVGIDFSGNPTKASFADFLSIFEAARAAGLRTAVHVGEVDHAADTESVLAFRPDRLGHALVLGERVTAALRAQPIPIELCPTSNIKTLRLASYAEHPTLAAWLACGYPLSISTDDSTVFGTTPSRELCYAAEIADLTPERLCALALAPLEHAFVDERTRGALRAEMAREARAALAAFF